MQLLKIVSCLLFMLLQIRNAVCLINMTTYKTLPPLYNFDDYDACLGHDSGGVGVYCVVYAEIVPNESIPLWLEIEKVSTDSKRHYRHDHLFFGVCLERCRSVPSGVLENNEISNDITDRELKAYYTDVYNSDEYSSILHNYSPTNVIRNCLNRDFEKEFNLNLRVFVEYCEESTDDFRWDIWHTIFTMIVIFVAILVILSSSYDFILKRRQPLRHQTNKFYGVRLNYAPHTLLTSFSVCRNYYNLKRAPNSKSEGDLKFLDGIRVVVMFLVILSHVLVIFMLLHVENPEFFEKYYYRVESTIFQNGSIILQFFFFMSGFLLYVNFMEREVVTTKSQFIDCFKAYFQLLSLRFLRLIPSIALVLLFTTSFLGNMQDGPFWRHITEAERRFCRDYWWKSLFLVNNIDSSWKNCLHHTWYIATDMQLFAIFLFVIVVISKYPKVKKILFGVLLMFGIIVPGLATYLQKLDAFFITNPETYRYLYFKDAPTLYGLFLPFYTNMPGYLFGVWSADIYRNIKKQKRTFHDPRLNFLWWFVLSSAIALPLSGYWFVAYDLEKPSLWEAAYAGLFRNIWLVMASLLILGLCFQVGWIGFEFLSLDCFRTLAKISYQSYVLHPVVIRVLMGHFRSPVHVNRLLMLSSFIATVVLTYVVAYFVALFFEFPLAEIIRCTSNQHKGHNRRNRETGESIGLSIRNVSKY